MQINGVAQEQIQELYDNAIAEIKSISLKTIKQNKNNSLGVLAFKNAIYFMNKEEIDLVLDTLGPNAKEDEFVVRVMSGEIEDIL